LREKRTTRKGGNSKEKINRRPIRQGKSRGIGQKKDLAYASNNVYLNRTGRGIPQWKETRGKKSYGGGGGQQFAIYHTYDHRRYKAKESRKPDQGEMEMRSGKQKGLQN